MPDYTVQHLINELKMYTNIPVNYTQLIATLLYLYNGTVECMILILVDYFSKVGNYFHKTAKVFAMVSSMVMVSLQLNTASPNYLCYSKGAYSTAYNSKIKKKQYTYNANKYITQ